MGFGISLRIIFSELEPKYEARLVLFLAVSDLGQGLLSLKMKEKDKFSLYMSAIHLIEGIFETAYSIVILLYYKNTYDGILLYIIGFDKVLDNIGAFIEQYYSKSDE